MDDDQLLAYDVLMTKVDVRIGKAGLYNFYKMQVSFYLILIEHHIEHHIV